MPLISALTEHLLQVSLADLVTNLLQCLHASVHNLKVSHLGPEFFKSDTGKVQLKRTLPGTEVAAALVLVQPRAPAPAQHSFRHDVDPPSARVGAACRD